MLDGTSFLRDGEVDWSQGWTIAEYYLTQDPTHEHLQTLLLQGNLKELYLFGQEYLYTQEDPTHAMNYLHQIYQNMSKQRVEEHVDLWRYTLQQPHAEEILQSSLSGFLKTLNTPQALELLFLCCTSEWDAEWVCKEFQPFDMETIWSTPGCVSYVQYWSQWYRYVWNPEFLFPLILPHLLQQDPQSHVLFARTLIPPMTWIPRSPDLLEFLERVYTTLVTASSQKTAHRTFELLQEIVGRVDRDTKRDIVMVLIESIPGLQIPGLMILKKYWSLIEWHTMECLWNRPLVAREDALENLDVLVHQLGVLKLCWPTWSTEQKKQVIQTMVDPISEWTRTWLKTSVDSKTKTTLELMEWYYLADLHILEKI
jgi:hypothetical protein